MPGTTLLPWQAGLWVAGCLERLAPYVHACGTLRAAAFYRDSVDAFWTGHGELAAPDADRIAAVGAKLRALCDEYSAEAQIFEVIVRAAEAARQPMPEPMEQLVTRTVDLWSELGSDDDSGDREAQAQRDTLAMTQQPPAQAAAQIRIVSARLGAEWAARLANHGLLNADPKRPEIVIPPHDLPYQVGDVVAVSCPWTPTVTTRAGKYYAAVRWPWGAVLDPDSAYLPNGSVAFPVDESTEPWWPYQLRPPAAELDEGDRCAVGVPPTRCYVVRSNRYDPPMDDGFLPRLTASIALLPVGSGYADAADVWLERAEPFEMKLLHRPYGALRSGDTVDDADGRLLQFVPPFLFYADNGRVRPAWPLALVTRDGVTPPSDAVDAVATATAVGGHADEIARWLTYSEAPYTATIAEELFDET
ncbi:hypothetical protein [Micromonospora aurantiaca]|uniref:hypothetical protein n=1 Tax=Micromonospora aurantiaca (nom. illeg.) TaxID=47850 RepID=UPI001E2E050D|nr:hypothetical protein [Micromonospora aurantiaca]UFN96257.1 hypothetical protein LF814_09015 [Micromonospora aurantiaca]